jgi:predicted nucleotidyltransferase
MVSDGPDLEAASPAGKDLRQRIRHSLAAQGEEHVVSAYLFGSAAAGSSHREGDVDVEIYCMYLPTMAYYCNEIC